MEYNLQNLQLNEKREVLTNWVNEPTDDEFTALHFASYHGNYSIIKFLVENTDVDIHKRTKLGSTVLHIAA